MPHVTVIIPCRNEEKFIATCLDSLEKQTYSKELMEVFVVDGMSDDGTRQIIAEYERRYRWINMLDNPDKTTAYAFNAGIKKSSGRIIIIMGAHAEYSSDYISKCVEYSESSGADNVGGILLVKPAKNTLVAKSIAFSLSSSFGVRKAAKFTDKKPFETDTVFGGCYKREVFEKIGLFNEKLARSQDMEFNMRLKKSGGKIMLFPDIVCYYYPKSNFKDFWTHNFSDGFWAVYPVKFMKMPLKLRHYIPMIFLAIILGLLGLSFWLDSFGYLLVVIIALYLVLVMDFGAKIAFREKNIRYLFLVPAAFSIRYLGYGFGSLYGIPALIIPEKNGKKN